MGPRMHPLRYLMIGPIACVALACASTGGGAPATSAQPAPDSPAAAPASPSGDQAGSVVPVVARETTPDRTRRESVPAHVREVRDQMEEAYQAGLEAYQAGRFDEAKGQFDRAVDIVLTSDIDLNEQPAFKKAFDEIVRNIADMDADLYSRENEPVEKEDRSPLDDLKDISTYLPPEEAEKERQKIQQVVGKISYDIPVVLNPRVLAYIEAFQTRLRDEFEPGLKRSGGYLPMVKKIFHEAGLPEDLAYMAHQESAFKVNAYSRARAQARSHSKDYWSLTKTRYIRTETKWYVAAILASILIDKSPEDYGFFVDLDPELKWDTLTVDKATDLQVIADAAGTSLEAVRALNPELRGLVTPPNASSYTLRVPDGSKDDVVAKLEALPEEQRVSWTLHEVRPGETFSFIAHKHGIPVRALLDANPRFVGKRLRRGMVLNVPISKSTPQVALAAASGDPTFEPGEKIVHRVRRGDTLQSIAARYRTTVANLKRWNNLASPILHPGQRLVAYYGEKGNGPRQYDDAVNAAVSVSGGRIEYKVQEGDTVASIALKFGVSSDDLCRWNNLAPDATLRPGDRVLVGEAQQSTGSSGTDGTRKGGREGVIRHRVKHGETLMRIARLYAVSVRQVRVWNRLESSTIYPGQVLTIRGVLPRPP